MELEYLAEVLEAKKKDYEKQSNLKKFYKETLTEEEYKNFEKILKTRKSEISELEAIVKKMNSYSDQYTYERIMAMTEIEFDAIRDSIIEEKKDEIRKHNKDIDEKNSSINREINDLLNENLALKAELEEMTNEIGLTGSYTKESVNRAKEIKSQIKENNDKIQENKQAIIDNDKKVIANGEISLDYESYKQEKLAELSDKKYCTEIPEVSPMDEFLCKLQKEGKTPEELEIALNSFKNSYVGGFDKEGYEYFDPVYRKDLDALEEEDPNASEITELLEKYFEIAEKGKAKCKDKGIIERSMRVAYNTNKRHNVNEVTKEQLLVELLDGKPYAKNMDENEIVNNGDFLNLKDRIIIQKERINRVIAWKNADSGNTILAKTVTHIRNYKDLSKDDKNINEIEKVLAKLRKYFDETCFDGCDAAIEFTTLYDELLKACAKLKSLNSEKDRISGKKIVINKKDQSKTLDNVIDEIEDLKDYIKEIHKRIDKDLDITLKYVTSTLDEPERIIYPEITDEPSKENIFSAIHTKKEHSDFSLEDEKEYLLELETDFKNAIMYLEKYDENVAKSKRAAITRLCDDLEIASIPDSIVDILYEEKANKEPIKASNIAKRINEARVNLYLREQKEKAISEASKAKSEILGAVLNKVNLDETKTDIFAAI